MNCLREPSQNEYSMSPELYGIASTVIFFHVSLSQAQDFSAVGLLGSWGADSGI